MACFAKSLRSRWWSIGHNISSTSGLSHGRRIIVALSFGFRLALLATLGHSSQYLTFSQHHYFPPISLVKTSLLYVDRLFLVPGLHFPLNLSLEEQPWSSHFFHIEIYICYLTICSTAKPLSENQCDCQGLGACPNGCQQHPRLLGPHEGFGYLMGVSSRLHHPI